ncbi:MAG: alpha/beta hydrolase [Pseudomonadota bacterium]
MQSGTTLAGGYGSSLRLWAALCYLLLLGACAPQRAYDAVLVLEDIAAAGQPSCLQASTPPPRRVAVAYAVAGRSHRADLYLPTDGPPQAGIVLVPGIVPLGNEDPRLVALATTLARARFAVLTPSMPSFRDLHVQPGNVREVADAFAYLASRPELAPDGRAGMGALSYAVGLAVLGALEPDIRDRVRFILGIGGYYDLISAITYFTTGYRSVGDRWTYLKPDEYGTLVFAMSSIPYLQNLQDRAVLDRMVQLRLKNPQADIAALAPRLGPEGRAVYDLLTNSDPRRTPALIARLPPKFLAVIDALSLHNKDLGHLRARLLLVHGMDDNLIPYTESIRLAQAMPRGQARLYLIHHILVHVEFKEQPLLSRRFWTEDLPDFWRMYQAVYALLGEREQGEHVLLGEN